MMDISGGVGYNMLKRELTKKLILIGSLLFVSTSNAQGISIFDPSIRITSTLFAFSHLGEEIYNVAYSAISTKFLDLNLAYGM